MQTHKFIGATLLTAGTCIGGGMLALPIVTAQFGFFPSLAIFIFVWLWMCYTGLLVTEATFWLPTNTSYVSISSKTLGSAGRFLTWLTFAFMLYALLAAYFSGGSELISILEKHYFHQVFPQVFNLLPWLIIYALILFFGAHFSDLINRILLFGLIITFAILCTIMTKEIKLPQLISYSHWNNLYLILPIILASFGYHIIVPTMRTYLGEQEKLLPRVVIIGSFIPFIIYLLWEFAVFSSIPVHGSNGLLAISQSRDGIKMLVDSIMNLTLHPWVSFLVRFFTFFAIATPFVGVSLGLFDLLSDGLKLKKNYLSKILLSLLTLIPPFIYALFYPKGFVLALSYAGILIAVLHGILPAIMVWSGRYRLHLKGDYHVFGGKIALIIVVLLSCFVIYVGLK